MSLYPSQDRGVRDKQFSLVSLYAIRFVEHRYDSCDEIAVQEPAIASAA